MFQVSTAHGKNDKVYDVTSLEELPTGIQNRVFLEGYKFGNVKYNPSFISGDTIYVYSYGDTPKGDIIALADEYITCKYPTGSRIFFKFTKIKDAIDFWEKYVKLPIYRVEGAKEGLKGNSVTLKYDLIYENPFLDKYNCKEIDCLYKGENHPGDIVIPAGTVIEHSIYNCKGKYKIPGTIGILLSTDTCRKLGYRWVDKNSGVEPYVGKLIRAFLEDVTISEDPLLEGMNLDDYHEYPYDHHFSCAVIDNELKDNEKEALARSIGRRSDTNRDSH